MAKIDAELCRIIRDERKLEKIRHDIGYRGEPQVIGHIFSYIKKGPKNIERLAEVEQAEKLTFAFLSGAPDALPKDEIAKYWGKYLAEYMRIECREQLIFERRYDASNYARDGLSYFDSITAATVKELLEEGLLEPDRNSYFAPSVQEMLDFCSGEEDETIWRFHGFAVSAERLDCRVRFEGMKSIAPPSPQRKAEFARLHSKADILETELDTGCYCWYD